MLPPAISEMSHPTAIARTVPHATIANARHSRPFRAVTVAPAAAVIGVISGATNIAPITTAAESASSPNAAMLADSTIRRLKRTTYSTNSGPSCGISSSIASCSSWDGTRLIASRNHVVNEPSGVSCGEASSAAVGGESCSV